ncbi:MAG: erythromycin biosynthesis sensory transduction protein eryC1 [Acidobacteria bacterium]|nr:MAG: erythromycin biosynthesis sensory transduction protein eryC1 [Acidobacteriota bacterium]
MIPLVDLKAQYQALKPEIAAAVEQVLESGQFVLGDQVAAFEQEFARYVDAAEAVAVNTGTSALHLALLAAGVGPGDEVITVPFTFVATVAAIGYTGARAVFVDIDPATFTMDVTLIEQAITSRTKAILPVHLYGHPADMTPILDVARRHGLIVIEDACQAHGAEYNGRRVGSIGLVGAFSFYPGKNLGACGEGGMAVTSDPGCARTMRMLRDWGQDRKYHHVLKGFNYRMEGLQGSILRVKLRHLDAWTEARRAHARGYAAQLAGAEVTTPSEPPWVRHVYHVYAIRTSSREALQRTLLANGVQTGIHYPIPVHLQPAYADLGYREGQFPQAERAAAEVLSLPMYPELSSTQRETVSAVLREEAYVI